MKYILKTDDDAKLNYSVVLKQLESKHGSSSPELLVECPSPFKHMKTERFRPNDPNSLLNKWAFSEEEISRRNLPPYCNGWVYVTTPDTAIRLAEMATNMPSKLMKINRMDDLFYGFVLEQIEGARVEQLAGGPYGSLWNNILSQCPFLGTSKNVFFNQVVIKKGRYVGGFDVNAWYFFCGIWEGYVVYKFEHLLPIPDFLLYLCNR